MDKSVLMEIITPEEMFYKGRVEMLIVSTIDGQEGFMKNHSWCCKLLAEDGVVKIGEEGYKKESGESRFKTASIKGGYIDVKEHFIVYTDSARWI